MKDTSIEPKGTPLNHMGFKWLKRNKNIYYPGHVPSWEGKEGRRRGEESGGRTGRRGDTRGKSVEFTENTPLASRFSSLLLLSGV